jgi:hypothetical protein
MRQHRQTFPRELDDNRRPVGSPQRRALGVAAVEEIRGLVPRRYSLIASRCSPSAGQPSARAVGTPSATARCWLMSASKASTGGAGGGQVPGEQGSERGLAAATLADEGDFHSCAPSW